MMLPLLLALSTSTPANVDDSEALFRRRVTPLVEVARDAAPAVVFIETNAIQPTGWIDRLGRAVGQRVEGMGSGVVIKKDGFIITNYHVIRGAQQIHVSFDSKYDEKKYEAEVVASVPEEDLALIKIHSDGEREFPVIPMGTSSDLMLGEPVVAIGNPLGQTHTVTQGIISGLHRNVPLPQEGLNFDNLIQTDASINPGNSGGPLLNINGELIGINSAMNTQAQNIGFAIPVDRVRTVLEERFAPTWLGFDIKAGDHLLVSQVIPGSPAEEAGIKAGDCVVEIGDQPVGTAEEYRLAKLGLSPQRAVDLKVQSQGKMRRVQLKPWDKNDGILYEHLGLRVKDQRRGRSGFVLVSDILPGGPAEAMGLGAGDAIEALRPVGRRSSKWLTDTRENFASLVMQFEPGQKVELDVYRDLDKNGTFTNDELHRGTIQVR